MMYHDLIHKVFYSCISMYRLSLDMVEDLKRVDSAMVNDESILACLQ